MLTVVGLSQRSAPVEVRERVAIGGAELPAALAALGHGIILSTCNRTEIYLGDDRPGDAAAATQLLAERAGGEVAALAGHLYEIRGENAVRHLYAVAASLDSLVLGEPQILGQVRQALSAAETAGTSSPVLARAFREALRVGRRARAETFIGRHAVSVSYAAVELARQVFGQLDRCRALVVGAGEMAELTTRTLVQYGVGVVAVVNRTVGHAEVLAERFGGRAIAFADLVPALRESDIVISSTDAAHVVISRDDVAAAVEGRVGRPLFVIDIAVPRDVDPSVRALENVHLYDIDDLRSLCDHNRAERRAEIQQVQAIIDEEAARFVAWWQTRQALPTVLALRARADEIRRAELAEALAKLRHLSDADRVTVEALSRAIVNKLLHEPTVRLKKSARQGGEATAAVRTLFGLDGARS